MNTRQVTDPLQALLAKEKALREDILNPRATEIDPGGFSMQQLGLRLVMVADDGRFWADTPDLKLKMIFDPNKRD